MIKKAVKALLHNDQRSREAFVDHNKVMVETAVLENEWVQQESGDPRYSGRFVAVAKIVSHFHANYNRDTFSDSWADVQVLGTIVRKIIKELNIPVRNSDLLQVVDKSINEILYVDLAHLQNLEIRKCKIQLERRQRKVDLTRKNFLELPLNSARLVPWTILVLGLAIVAGYELSRFQ